MAVIDIVRRRAGILQDVHTHLQPGQEDVDLGVGAVHSIVTVVKNGTTITQGAAANQYAWNLYRSYITLNTPASDGDEIFVQAQRVFSDTAVNDVISEAQNMIVYPALKPLYDYDDFNGTPTVDALVAAYATGRLRQDMGKGGTLEDPKYRSGLELINSVKEILAAIRSGATGLCKADGTEVPTKEGAFVGAFIHPDGALDGRLKVIDRTQRWLGVLRNYWPEIAPADVVDARNLA